MLAYDAYVQKEFRGFGKLAGYVFGIIVLHHLWYGIHLCPWFIVDRTNTIDHSFRTLSCSVGFSRIIYVLPTAVHRYTSWSTDCSHLKQLMSPTCMQVFSVSCRYCLFVRGCMWSVMLASLNAFCAEWKFIQWEFCVGSIGYCIQYVQRYLSNSRTHRLHNLTRAAIEAIRQETPHANIDILNPFPISGMFFWSSWHRRYFPFSTINRCTVTLWFIRVSSCRVILSHRVLFFSN